jgi:predicted metal-dependent peptidase
MTPIKLTHEQEEAMAVARVGLMAACPFYAHYFYAEMKECATLQVPTAATDGRTIFFNPDYMLGLKPAERVFVLAHEIDHVMCRDPQRMVHYGRETNVTYGGVTTRFEQGQYNINADYVRNANLLETGVGQINPAWCYADDVAGSDLVEEVYHRKYKQKPPAPTCYGDSGGKAASGTKRDPFAANGTFDQLLPPSIDPVTGKQDLPDEAEFKEAIARAAAAAKAMGKLHANHQKLVDEILAPQVDWREQIRMILTGHMGARHETWSRPNRRRLALNAISREGAQMVVMPGRRGYGAELVVVGVDTSGSIYASPQAVEAFFGEVSGVLADVRPRRVILVECDARVQRVTEASSLDELEIAKQSGVKGGGGTSFVPVFDYIAENDLVPDTLIYLTDLEGTFPRKAPGYPVVWCSITAGKAPFGDTVHITV